MNITPQNFRTIRDLIRAGNVDELNGFFAKNPELLDCITPLGSWLHIATTNGRLEIVKLLVSLGIDINTKGGPEDSNALNIAALDGHKAIAAWMLDNGAIMDVSEPERNPLFGAILGNQIELVRLLVERGIDFQVQYTGKSMKNMDALAFALERGQTEIAQYLATLNE